MSDWTDGSSSDDTTAGMPPPPPPPGASPPGGAALGGRGRAGIIPLHPLSLGDVIDTAFKLFRATAVPVMLTVAIVYAPLSLIIALGSANMPTGAPGDPGDPAAAMNPFAVMSTAEVVLVGVGYLATVVLGPLVTAAVTWIALQRENGVEVGWQEAYRLAWSRFGRLIGAILLLFLLTIAAIVAVAVPAFALGAINVGLGILVGVVLGIPTILVIAVLYYYVIPVIVVEDAPAWAAIRRAAGLLRKRFWPVVGTIIVAGILIGIVGAVLSFGFGLLGFLAGPAAFVFEALGTTTSSMVTVPLAANVALLIYLDARIRHEGLDIEILTADLARAP